MPTLTELVEQYVYTHMANVPGRKALIELVSAGEETYLRKIAELEQDAAIKKFGAKAESADLSRFAGESPQVDVDDYSDPLTGTRYAGCD